MPKLYNSRWEQLRKAFLEYNPLCFLCSAEGRGPVAASVVDHITPHKGDVELFWDTDNLIPLCKHCHDSVAQKIERSGRYVWPTGEDGYPKKIRAELKRYLYYKANGGK